MVNHIGEWGEAPKPDAEEKSQLVSAMMTTEPNDTSVYDGLSNIHSSDYMIISNQQYTQQQYSWKREAC